MNNNGFFTGNDDRFYIGDERIKPYLSYKKDDSRCVYCANLADSREHLPPRIFIDKAITKEWNIVPACRGCNNDFSQNEQFVACAIEYLVALAYYDGQIQRDKIISTFEKRPHLLKKIKSLCIVRDELVVINKELIESIEKVVLKIAKGHLAYECSYIHMDDMKVTVMFEPQLTEELIEEYNAPVKSYLLPEIGSRASNELSSADNQIMSFWKIIDEKNYRYLISYDGIMRLVIREFLYAEIQF